MLCQATYYGRRDRRLGDNFEVIAVWDVRTRELYDMLAWPGYLGTIQAGEYTFQVNEPIRRGDTPLSRTTVRSRPQDRREHARHRPRADPRVPSVSER